MEATSVRRLVGQQARQTPPEDDVSGPERRDHNRYAADESHDTQDEARRNKG